jgi:transposase
MATITIGVDLSKSFFSICRLDEGGRVVKREDLRRGPFAQWLAQQAPGTVIAMEACGGAHHWARRCLAHELVPRLMAAQFVAPFRKSAAAKNDRNDAEAIATATRQGNVRFVAVKTIEQQARLSQHRIREGYKVEGLAIGNRIRGLLAELGIVVSKTEVALRRALARLPEFDLPEGVRGAIAELQRHLIDVRRRSPHRRHPRPPAAQGPRPQHQRQEQPTQRPRSHPQHRAALTPLIPTRCVKVGVALMRKTGCRWTQGAAHGRHQSRPRPATRVRHRDSRRGGQGSRRRPGRARERRE